MRISFVFLLVTVTFSWVGCQQDPDQSPPVYKPYTQDGTEVFFDSGKAPFYHGVASGDPLQDRVVIWTRVTPISTRDTIKVAWNIGTDPEMKKVIKGNIEMTESERDFCVKVDVKGLEPGTTYYYQFQALGKKSEIGRTRTMPSGSVQEAHLAVISCTNYEAGYFTALGNLAKRQDINAVLHLGDYIYEYEPNKYGNKKLDRKHLPKKEILRLQDYRTRYAQYRLDPDFQEVHQMHPFITIWDDHEISNNAYKDGAQNHQFREGVYRFRKQAAKRAYYEWMPIRDWGQYPLYRQIKCGDLADILMLDERLEGRVAPVDSMDHPDYMDEGRTMLGEEQFSWLINRLKESEAKWKVIGNQVMFSELDIEAFFPKRPRNLDAWDGYPMEKRKLTSFFQEENLRNTLFLTGDTHASWAFEVPTSRDNYASQGRASVVAAEFGTTSISSPNWDERRPVDTVLKAEGVLTKTNPHLKYVNLRDHGYLLIHLSPEQVVGEWWYVSHSR